MEDRALTDSLAYDDTARLHPIVFARCGASTQVAAEPSYGVGIHSAGEKNAQEARVAHRVEGFGKIHCHRYASLRGTVVTEAGHNLLA